MQTAICSSRGTDLQRTTLLSPPGLSGSSVQFTLCVPAPPGLWNVPDGLCWSCLATGQNPQTSSPHTASGMRTHMQNTRCLLFYTLTYAKETIPSSSPMRTRLIKALPTRGLANVPAALCGHSCRLHKGKETKQFQHPLSTASNSYRRET